MARSEPVKHTCPDIDRIKDTILSIINELEGINEYDFSSEISDLKDIGVGSRCELESLRYSNGTLRDWGNEMAEEAEKYEKELYKANDTISELESKIEQLQDEVNDLATQLQTT